MKTLPLFMLLIAGALSYGGVGKTVVEVYFVVDPTVVTRYQKWGYGSANSARKQFEAEFYNSIDEVNNMYGSMKRYGLDLQLRVLGLDFESYPVYSGLDFSGGNKITTTNALNTFGNFLRMNKIRGYDVAVVLTANDIINPETGESSVAGVAWLSRVCNGDATAVIEVPGNQRLANDIAHEVAHSLGAEHDGKNNNCRASDEYVMSPYTGGHSKRRWSFSACSAQHIMNNVYNLQRIDYNCLADTYAKKNIPTKKNPELLNPDNICRRTIYENSYLCRAAGEYKDGPKGDAVCKVLWCSTPEGKCTSQFSSEGMVCDIGRRCKEGQCLPAPRYFPTPRDTDPACLYGDTKRQKVFTDVDGPCTIAITSKDQCQSNYARTNCCATCKRLLGYL